MTIDELNQLITDSKLTRFPDFNRNDKRLHELAIYLNEQYSSELMWDPNLIAGKLYELEQYANITITKDLIDKSIVNYINSNIPYQKNLEYFIVSYKTVDDVEEFTSDLLTFSSLGPMKN